MLLFLLSTALAEPLMVHLEEGEAAPIHGRLMNDEAIANIIAGREMLLSSARYKKSLLFH